MIAVFLQTLPFFALIGLGYGAGRFGGFGAAATAALTKFVFYFALSAMLFKFASQMSLGSVFSWSFVLAYLLPCFLIYGMATTVALVRKRGIQEAAVEAQCATIGNVGFLGIPMFLMLFGEPAIGPLMLVLAVDLIVFSSLIVIVITGSRDGRMSPAILKTVGLGLLRNPMIMSIGLGLMWSFTDWSIPAPAMDFLNILGAAATPGALFAIGASLAGKSAERVSVALWLTTCKLILHPLVVAISALLIFQIDPFSATIMIAAASLPVAGNVFILAQHFGVAPHRVSASIFISTLLSVATVPFVISWLANL